MSRARLVLAAVVAGLLLPAAGVSSSAAAEADSAVTRSYMAGLRLTTPDQMSHLVIKALRVPDVTCGPNRFQGLALGIGSEPTAGSREYFAGVVITCRGGKASYRLSTTIGEVEKTDETVAPGDDLQIGVSFNCPSYPTCSVSAFVSNLSQDFYSIDIEADTTLTSNAAEFAGFPVYRRAGARPASVPTFDSAWFRGCLFNDRLINRRDERLVRNLGGGASLRPGGFTSGSFHLEYHAAR